MLESQGFIINMKDLNEKNVLGTRYIDRHLLLEGVCEKTVTLPF